MVVGGVDTTLDLRFKSRRPFPGIVIDIEEKKREINGR